MFFILVVIVVEMVNIVAIVGIVNPKKDTKSLKNILRHPTNILNSYTKYIWRGCLRSNEIIEIIKI